MIKHSQKVLHKSFSRFSVQIQFSDNVFHHHKATQGLLEENKLLLSSTWKRGHWFDCHNLQESVLTVKRSVKTLRIARAFSSSLSECAVSDAPLIDGGDVTLQRALLSSVRCVCNEKRGERRHINRLQRV